MAHLFIRLLSPFEVTLNGELGTAFRSDKERALLAYLCLESQDPQPREKLAGLLWPDSPESAACTNLRSALANLRKVIGDRPQNHKAETTPTFLLITRKTIQFNSESDVWVDALAFLSTLEKSHATVGELENAVACYRDGFMASFLSLTVTCLRSGWSFSGNDLEGWLLMRSIGWLRLTQPREKLNKPWRMQGAWSRWILSARAHNRY